MGFLKCERCGNTYEKIEINKCPYRLSKYQIHKGRYHKPINLYQECAKALTEWFEKEIRVTNN